MGIAKPKWNSEFKQPKGSKPSLKKTSQSGKPEIGTELSLASGRCQTFPVSREPRTPLFSHLQSFQFRHLHLSGRNHLQKERKEGAEKEISHTLHMLQSETNSPFPVSLSLPQSPKFLTTTLVLKYFCWFTNIEPEIALFSPLVSAATSSNGRTTGSNNHYLTASSQPFEGLVTTR